MVRIVFILKQYVMIGDVWHPELRVSNGVNTALRMKMNPVRA